LSIDIRKPSSGRPKHSDHYCIHFGPVFTNDLQKNAILSATAINYMTEVLIMSVSPKHAEPNTWIRVGGRRLRPNLPQQ
jgi:hypothetical protein